MRESKLNPWGDIYISGHRHIWVSHHEEGTDGKLGGPSSSGDSSTMTSMPRTVASTSTSMVRHALPSSTPQTPLQWTRIKVVWDVDEAADMLNWKRAKAGLSRQDYSNPLG